MMMKRGRRRNTNELQEWNDHHHYYYTTRKDSKRERGRERVGRVRERERRVQTLIKKATKY